MLQNIMIKHLAIGPEQEVCSNIGEISEEKMKNCEPIIWSTWEPVEPESFPCMICKKREATVFVDIISNPLTIRLSLCAFCAGFPEEELQARVLKGEKP